MREIFDPRMIRVWRDSSANVQPCFFVSAGLKEQRFRRF
jgi:hypothetical protein